MIYHTCISYFFVSAWTRPGYEKTLWSGRDADEEKRHEPARSDEFMDNLCPPEVDACGWSRQALDAIFSERHERLLVQCFLDSMHSQTRIVVNLDLFNRVEYFRKLTWDIASLIKPSKKASADSYIFAITLSSRNLCFLAARMFSPRQVHNLPCLKSILIL